MEPTNRRDTPTPGILRLRDSLVRPGTAPLLTHGRTQPIPCPDSLPLNLGTEPRKVTPKTTLGTTRIPPESTFSP